MAVTVKQIAQHAGVSASTVSHILNNRGQYNEKTRARVKQTADDLGYRPNRFAQGIRKGRFDCISLVLAHCPTLSYLPPYRLAGIHDELLDHGIHLVNSKLPEPQLENKDYISSILRELMSDGLLINYNTKIPTTLTQFVEQSQLPAVWINSKHDVDCVRPDDLKIGYQATRHLIEMGHRDIAFLDYQGLHDQSRVWLHYSAFDHLNGYRQAMEEEGLDLSMVHDQTMLVPEDKLDFSRHWLQQPNRPTAVLALTVLDAVPVYVAALLQGLKVPEDLSIVTVINDKLDLMSLPLTAFTIPNYEMGRAATSMLLKKIKNPAKKMEPLILEATFSQGSTCAPPTPNY